MRWRPLVNWISRGRGQRSTSSVHRPRRNKHEGTKTQRHNEGRQQEILWRPSLCLCVFVPSCLISHTVEHVIVNPFLIPPFGRIHRHSMQEHTEMEMISGGKARRTALS